MLGHHDLILEQFTRQAVPFSTAPGIRDEDALRLLVECSGAGPTETVLDVACGPGLVVAAFARMCRHVTGIDLTPAMIERARTLAAERGLDNVTLAVGDVLPLPYADDAFSVVVSRFAFHHFPDPRAVLREMARVCRPGGRVVVADAAASLDPAKAAAFNRMEKLRDPSHVRALSLPELMTLFADAGLGEPAITRYALPADLDGLLSRSFPAPGDADEIRAVFQDSLGADGLGVGAHEREGRIHFAYPIAILAAARGA
ncbi:MAG TPA: methyltransferase domain-containing protein [Methylomirabilota bacterium]